MSQDEEHEKNKESIGSVSDEAVKLLGALQGWARERGSDYGGTAEEVAAEAASSFHSLNKHIATGGEDCRYCPICQLISAVRETSPEVKQHFASAASSFVQAAAGMLATHLPNQKGGTPEPGVEKIDLSDGGDWGDD